ncbi:L,D-transpeptidase family protein [Cellulomonas sp. URHE0023]|uniref:L,D-transpeptidase family protein n=1 Tax=Cellulomonas sp. URHE0023 TaxID=1380354 RepID=UPI00055273BF|nr:L,D-transpeptidase family protein [Cellulomonas sp. URHE0023]
MRSPLADVRALLATGALLVALAACSAEQPATTSQQSAAPTHAVVLPTAAATAEPVPAPEPAPAHSVAEASVAVVTAYDAPDGAVVSQFSHPIASGAPLTFYVEEQQGQWLRVRLPMRPNGTTGWVRSSDVTVSLLHYSLLVSTAGHTVTLVKDGVVQQTFPAAVGTGDTPTPLGDFYLTELLAPTNAGYGPYAYGISAFSDVLNEFGGGPGQIGLHGTDDTDSVGQSASHGCIRLHNADITTLANLLPLGTPITIE